MATKFMELLSQDGDVTLQKRAVQIETQAKIAQTSLVNELRKKRVELELKLTDLTDLSFLSMSLANGERWSADQWVKDIQLTKMELYNNKIALEIAEKTMQEYFSEV